MRYRRFRPIEYRAPPSPYLGGGSTPYRLPIPQTSGGGGVSTGVHRYTPQKPVQAYGAAAMYVPKLRRSAYVNIAPGSRSTTTAIGGPRHGVIVTHTPGDGNNSSQEENKVHVDNVVPLTAYKQEPKKKEPFTEKEMADVLGLFKQDTYDPIKNAQDAQRRQEEQKNTHTKDATQEIEDLEQRIAMELAA